MTQLMLNLLLKKYFYFINFYNFINIFLNFFVSVIFYVNLIILIDVIFIIISDFTERYFLICYYFSLCYFFVVVGIFSNPISFNFSLKNWSIIYQFSFLNNSSKMNRYSSLFSRSSDNKYFDKLMLCRHFSSV